MAASSSDKWTLLFSASPVNILPLPNGVQRIILEGPAGELELLRCLPKTNVPNRPPILFQHGGFGSAEMFLDFIQFFADKGFPSYALSLRNHGSSHRVGYFRLVYMTGIASYSRDLVAAIRYIREYHSRDNFNTAGNAVLVGHSSGAGLSQYILTHGMEKCAAFISIGGIPSFGGFGVYRRWWAMDPWFYIRMLWHWHHPRSPLSSTTLVHKAFFSPEFPRAEVKKFEPLMAEYESLLWPTGMMFRWFCNVRKVLMNLNGFGGGRVCIIAGSQDALMGVKLPGQTAEQYRKERTKLVAEKKCEPVESDIDWGEGEKRITSGGGAVEGMRAGVGFRVVEGSGHHLQNDLYWEECAGQILEYLEHIGA